ncbi:murein transglycosylase A [Anabaena subtropica]|uniref:peptidoglycan lytic exotransglycosylase n=1 Tax=Anabaena subtropica FACHB-260 TaxID=2692884 RepID=A0ABR8CUL5_9NOST|nr:murein transglycosylase A [Anabaena subtropica]MBD2346892.1 murein transglycosylase A [Anabaena subtropica FACHB-260]
MMRKTLALVSLSLGIAVVNPIAVAQVINVPSPLPSNPATPSPATQPPLRLVEIGNNCVTQNPCLGLDEQIFGVGRPSDRQALLRSIDNSLRYLTTNTANRLYQNYPVRGITLDRVRRSLLRFRQLVVNSKTPAQLQSAVRREFAFYQSVGNDGKGTVKFTSYYEPVYSASRVRTSVYKYPLYRLPSNFSQWSKPHPTRLQLEGKDGLQGHKSPLRGSELLWFRDRLDAYMVHIQGSAQIQLTDGKRTAIGYAGGTDYPWTSIGRELAKDGKLPLAGMTMPKMISFFRQEPHELNNYLPRWERFVFFQETGSRPATGSINVPVTAERSIATDKSLMPPGALALVHTSIPFPAAGGRMEYRTVSRYVLDQDTGSAITGPGRVDYFMGTGKVAGDRAGVTGGNGSLYYLLLRR